MGLFLEAAKSWKRLQSISYTFIIGHKDVAKTIHLCFRPVDFDHLSGIHKADDVDFKLHRRVYRGAKLADAVISQKINHNLIEKSIHWTQIADRLCSIILLEKILDSDFCIYSFNPCKLPFYSKIEANYLIYSDQYQMGVFLFIAPDQSVDYCKSIFSKDDQDFTVNQTKWAMLKKIKSHGDTEDILFVSTSYHESE